MTADQPAPVPGWDEQTRPTYPVPPGATYTRVQLAQSQHLVDVHDMLRAELTQVLALVDQVRRGLLQVGQARSVLNTMTMRQHHWSLGAYCEAYCRVVTGHHTLEDHSMLRHLTERDPAVGPVVERLHAEHEVIAGVLEDVDRHLVALVAAAPEQAPAAMEDLVGVVGTLERTLRSHLAYEEAELHHSLAVHGMQVG